MLRNKFCGFGSPSAILGRRRNRFHKWKIIADEAMEASITANLNLGEKTLRITPSHHDSSKGRRGQKKGPTANQAKASLRKRLKQEEKLVAKKVKDYLAKEAPDLIT